MISRDVLAGICGATLLGVDAAVAFGYVLAVLTWPSVRRVLKKGVRQ